MFYHSLVIYEKVPSTVVGTVVLFSFFSLRIKNINAEIKIKIDISILTYLWRFQKFYSYFLIIYLKGREKDTNSRSTGSLLGAGPGWSQKFNSNLPWGGRNPATWTITCYLPGCAVSSRKLEQREELGNEHGQFNVWFNKIVDIPSGTICSPFIEIFKGKIYIKITWQCDYNWNRTDYELKITEAEWTGTWCSLILYLKLPMIKIA